MRHEQQKQHHVGKVGKEVDINQKNIVTIKNQKNQRQIKGVGLGHTNGLGNNTILFISNIRSAHLKRIF